MSISVVKQATVGYIKYYTYNDSINTQPIGSS